MQHTAYLLLACAMAFACGCAGPGAGGSSNAAVENFDTTAPGQLPANWKAGVTGGGQPRWTVQALADAPSKPNVLKQSGEGRFPWCIKQDVALADGFVQVRYRALSGKEDQVGGLIWRFKDGDNYYIARANALENNVTIYHTIGGKRTKFKNIDMPVAANQWHTLRVEFAGNRFRVIFNGKEVLDATDDKITGPGAVGLWTKADSVTVFDNFEHSR